MGDDQSRYEYFVARRESLLQAKDVMRRVDTTHLHDRQKCGWPFDFNPSTGKSYRRRKQVDRAEPCFYHYWVGFCVHGRACWSNHDHGPSSALVEEAKPLHSARRTTAAVLDLPAALSSLVCDFAFALASKRPRYVQLAPISQSGDWPFSLDALAAEKAEDDALGQGIVAERLREVNRQWGRLR